jgi:hypothetical protein
MVVFTERFTCLRAYGIVSDRIAGGKPCVISGSILTRHICEQTWEEFSQGNCVSIEPYLSASSDAEVLRRARFLIGSPYNPLTWRGEYMVAHEFQPKPLGFGAFVMAILVALSTF